MTRAGLGLREFYRLCTWCTSVQPWWWAGRVLLLSSGDMGNPYRPGWPYVTVSFVFQSEQLISMNRNTIASWFFPHDPNNSLLRKVWLRPCLRSPSDLICMAKSGVERYEAVEIQTIDLVNVHVLRSLLLQKQVNEPFVSLLRCKAFCDVKWETCSLSLQDYHKPNISWAGILMNTSGALFDTDNKRVVRCKMAPAWKKHPVNLRRQIGLWGLTKCSKGGGR